MSTGSKTWRDKITERSLLPPVPIHSRIAGIVLIVVGIITATLLFVRYDMLLWQRDDPLEEMHFSKAGSYLAGVHAFKSRDFGNAARFFTEALEEGGSDALLYDSAYLSLLLSGDVKGAQAMVRRYPSAVQPPMAGGLLRAVEAVDNGNYLLAEKILQEPSFAKTEVDKIIAPFLVSWCEVGQQRFRDALAKLEAIPKTTGNRAFIAYQMALISDMAGLQKEAEKYFSVALAEPGSSYRFTKAAGNFYERIGKKEAAANLYKTYMGNDNAAAMFKKELERIAKNTYVRPSRFINNIAEGIGQVLLEVASGFYKEQLFTEAQVYLQIMLYLEPSSSQAHFLLANYYEGMGDLKQAVSHYQQIDEGSDFFWQSQLNIALDLFKMGNGRAAKKHLFSLSKLHPSDYEVLLILADILRSESQFTEAINIYSQILSTSATPPPHYWYAFYMRAIAYEQAKMWDKAEADLLAALALNPDQEEVLNYLGYNWINSRKNIKQAKAMIHKALQQFPDNPQFIDSMGWALFAEGDYVQAISYLEDALEFLPVDPTINDHLGDAYRMVGRKLEAEFQWQRAIRFSTDRKEIEKINVKLESKNDAKIEERTGH